MALLWAESMSKYLATSDNDVFNDNFNWSGNTVSPGDMVASVGRFGGNAYFATTRQTNALIRVPFTGMSGTTMILGVAIKFNMDTVVMNGVQGILECFTAATGGSQHFSLAATPAGGFVMFGADSQAPFYSSPNIFYHQVWHWLELKVSLLQSGSFELRIDGVNVFSGSGDFRNGATDTSTIDSLRFNGTRSSGSGTGSVQYGYFVILDGSGGSFNDFLGDLRFENTVPNGDGATANWTSGNAGANYTNLDEAVGAYNKDTGSDYITSATDDQVNLCGHVDHVLTDVNVIHFAELTALAKNDGAKNLALEVVSNGTTDDSATVTLVNGTYKWCNKIWTVDPHTSAAWTLANINAAEWGVKEKA